MTGLNTAIHQHKMNLMAQMDPHKSLAQENLQKVIRQYSSWINGAENSQDAQAFAQGLEQILAAFGKNLADVDGLNTDLLNGNIAADKAGKAGQKGSEFDKKIIADLSNEFGIDVKKAGTTKDWLELAKKDQNVRVLDKSGNEVTNEREGRIKSGDILEVNSKQHGLVRISVGGDGEINGGDDKVISIGGKAAAGNMVDGLNQINNVPQQAPQGQAVAGAGVLNGLFGTNPLQQDPTQAALNPDQAQNLFSEKQIKSLVAAILDQAMNSVYYREQQQQQQQYV
jgi:hypothetical protein